MESVESCSCACAVSRLSASRSTSAPLLRRGVLFLCPRGCRTSLFHRLSRRRVFLRRRCARQRIPLCPPLALVSRRSRFAGRCVHPPSDGGRSSLAIRGWSSVGVGVFSPPPYLPDRFACLSVACVFLALPLLIFVRYGDFYGR